MPKTPKNAKITRKKALFGTIDIIEVFDEALIQRVESLPEVQRPGENDRKTPWIARNFLKYSIFRLLNRRDYSLGMSAEDQQRHQRIGRQFTPSWHRMESEMLREALFDMPHEPMAVERALAVIWASRALEQSAIERDNGVSDEIIRAGLAPLTAFGAVLDPVKVGAAWFAKRKLEKYLKPRLRRDVELADAVHNFCAILQAAAPALRAAARDVAKQSDFSEKFQQIVLDSPIIPQVLRVVNSKTTLDGLLKKKTKPGKTMILLHIGKIANKNRDESYLFGTNSPSRQCPFKPLLYEMASNVSEMKPAPLT